jgi:hypothetical protein
MPRGGARTNAGRKEKPKIQQSADKGIASRVLAMDGPPIHIRQCDCSVCTNRKTLCKCDPKAEPPIVCFACKIYEDHRICRCEECGWWEVLTAADKRLRFEGRRYLTDRREGKPAQGVFIGDTRESALDLDFGNLIMPSAPANKVKPGAAGKPN